MEPETLTLLFKLSTAPKGEWWAALRKGLGFLDSSLYLTQHSVIKERAQGAARQCLIRMLRMLVLYMNILLITGDFQNLEIFLNKIDELITYLNNPVIRNEDKRDILTKLLKSQVNEETFKFLLVLSV